MISSFGIINYVQMWLVSVLVAVVTVLSGYALYHTLTTPEQALTSEGKRTRNFRALLNGLAVVVSFLALTPAGPVGLSGALTALIIPGAYLADVRPAVTYWWQSRRGGGGTNNRLSTPWQGGLGGESLVRIGNQCSTGGKMRAMVQRAQGASCSVEGEVPGSFEGPGLVVLVGATPIGIPKEAQAVARKAANLRIFDGPGTYDMDVAGSERLVEARGREASTLDLGLSVLVVSQSTLYGDTHKGNRPPWVRAAPGETAAPLVEEICVALESMEIHVERGVLGADMQLSSTDDGPFATLLEPQSAPPVVNKVGKALRGGLECK